MPHASASCSFSSAARVDDHAARRRSTSRAVTRLLGTSATPAMLRTDSASFVVERHVDEQRLAGRRRAASASPTAALVLISPRRQRVDDDQRAVLQLLRQRRAQRAALDLLRQLEVVAARLRPEHRAALAPQRVADLADARAAGALLPPRLLAAAADERAVLRRVRAAALRRVRAARPTPRSGRSSRGRRTRRRCSVDARRPSRSSR